MKFFTTSDGIKIAYTYEGDKNAPLVVLVHGFGANYVVNWKNPGWVDILTQAGFSTLLLDMRGHGSSDAPHKVSRYSLVRMAMDVVELLDHEEQRKVHIMGYSMGGMVTLLCASLYPTRFASATCGGIGETLILDTPDPAPILDALAAPSLDAIDPLNLAGLMFRVFTDANHQDPKAMYACFQGIHRNFPIRVLPPILTPILLVTGEEDVQAGSPRGLLKLIPHAKIVEVEGKDHMKTVGDPVYKRAATLFIKEHNHLLGRSNFSSQASLEIGRKISNPSARDAAKKSHDNYGGYE